MQQAAYDLDNFANRPDDSRPRVRVAKGGVRSRRRAELMYYFRITITLALLLGLTVSLLYSYAELNEITLILHWIQNELNEARSEYDYLSSELNSKTNLKAVEEIAGSQLGLMKLDKSQVTYITLEDENQISRPESNTAELLQSNPRLGLTIAPNVHP